MVAGATNNFVITLPLDVRSRRRSAIEQLYHQLAHPLLAIVVTALAGGEATARIDHNGGLDVDRQLVEIIERELGGQGGTGHRTAE